MESEFEGELQIQNVSMFGAFVVVGVVVVAVGVVLLFLVVVVVKFLSLLRRNLMPDLCRMLYLQAELPFILAHLSD